MRMLSTNIPSKGIKIVAKKMINKYPTMFRDVDENGMILGDGSHSLYSKIQDRNNCLNRPHKRKLDNPTPNPVEIKKMTRQKCRLFRGDT